MPDLLGATNPVPGYDKPVNNRNTQTPSHYEQLENVPDLTKVNGPDRRTEQQQSDLRGDQNIRYGSNFQAFLERLRQAPDMLESLSDIFSGWAADTKLSEMQEGITLEMAKILEMLQMDESQLQDFLLQQVKTGTIFNGDLCELLRNAYSKADSETIKNSILQFLKSYSDCMSSEHIEKNMLRNLQRMADAMPARWTEQLREMTAQLENSIKAGDRMDTLRLLQKGIFPYMSDYVERTHDMGLPRQLLTQLALDIVRYENGSEQKVLQLFHQLRNCGIFRNNMEFLDDEVLAKLVDEVQRQRGSVAMQFSNALTSAASKFLQDGGNQQIQQGFQNLLAAMLLNESVYMPLNHYIVPLQWQGKMLFSEMWVDPDAENENGQSRGGSDENVRRMLIKVEIQSLGAFDIVLTNQKKDVNLLIACPEKVGFFHKQIEQAVTQILIRNDLNPLQISVTKMEKPMTVLDVFPRSFQGRNGVNVKA